MNAKMTELKSCLERAGFSNVKTVLASGNVVFDARTKSDTALARDIEAAMARYLDRTFYTIVRPVSRLQELIHARSRKHSRKAMKTASGPFFGGRRPNR
jgi:uncharacterized protein (DUF1697 family)